MNETPATVCSNCGESLVSGARFCRICGMAINRSVDEEATSALTRPMNVSLLNSVGPNINAEESSREALELGRQTVMPRPQLAGVGSRVRSYWILIAFFVTLGAAVWLVTYMRERSAKPREQPTDANRPTTPAPTLEQSPAAALTQPPSVERRTNHSDKKEEVPGAKNEEQVRTAEHTKSSQGAKSEVGKCFGKYTVELIYAPSGYEGAKTGQVTFRFYATGRYAYHFEDATGNTCKSCPHDASYKILWGKTLFTDRQVPYNGPERFRLVMTRHDGKTCERTF